MKNLKDIYEQKSKEIVERKLKNQGKEYRYLWVSVNFAVAKDGYIAKIGARAFGIFIVIRTFMGKDCCAYPSLHTISKLSGCSITTVQKEIHSLIRHGWLKKSGRKNLKNGKFGNRVYEILEKELIRGVGQKGFMEQPLVDSTNGDCG